MATEANRWGERTRSLELILQQEQFQMEKTSHYTHEQYQRTALQVYEEDRFSCTFTAAPASTTQIQTFKFMLLPPHQVFALLQNVNIADNSGVKLTQVGWELYRELFHGLNQLNNAMAGFRRKQTKQKILY